VAAAILTLTLTVIVAGLVWLALGARVRLAPDPRQNDLLNFLAYAGVVLPIALVVVFFLIERL
jgi:hypothetical protein